MAPHSSTLAWKIPWMEEAWWAAVHGVSKSRTRLNDFTFTFHFHALEKEMATHSSVLAWRIPETGELGGLPSIGLHRDAHDWSDLAVAAVARKPLKGFLPLQNEIKIKANKCKSSSWDDMQICPQSFFPCPLASPQTAQRNPLVVLSHLALGSIFSPADLVSAGGPGGMSSHSLRR